MATKMIAVTTKAAHDSSVASRWPQPLVRRPPTSRTAAPSNGSATSSQLSENTPEAAAGAPASAAASTDVVIIWVSSPFSCLSELEQVGVVDRGRAAGAEDAQDDGQPDDD